VCRKSNGRLTIKRARFSALTHNEVWRAVGTHLGLPDDAAAAAVQLRQEIDLRLGAAFTRFQTMALQDAFDWGAFANEEGKGPLISYGPCQFPTLGFIVRRAWEAAAHVPERFWRIVLSHAPGGGAPGRADFLWKRARLFDERCAGALFELCVSAGTALVTDVSGAVKHRWAPVPLNTLEMQKRTCSKLRISPEAVMKLAEELYQTGFISYPRTETDAFPKDLDLRAIVGALCVWAQCGGCGCGFVC
jgi:DNA topoisomerase-3